MIDDGRLVRAAEDLRRMRHDVLIQWVVLGDEHDERSLLRASGAARLLPRAGDGARIPGDDARVQPAYVDPELERARRRDPEQPSVGEVALQRAPLLGQVAGAVRGDPAGEVPAFVGEQVACVLGDELGALA